MDMISFFVSLLLFKFLFVNIFIPVPSTYHHRNNHKKYYIEIYTLTYSTINKIDGNIITVHTNVYIDVRRSTYIYGGYYTRYIFTRPLMFTTPYRPSCRPCTYSIICKRAISYCVRFVHSVRVCAILLSRILVGVKSLQRTYPVHRASRTYARICDIL